MFPFIDWFSVLQKHQWPEKIYSTFDVVETFVQYDITNFPTHLLRIHSLFNLELIQS